MTKSEQINIDLLNTIAISMGFEKICRVGQVRYHSKDNRNQIIVDQIDQKTWFYGDGSRAVKNIVTQ